MVFDSEVSVMTLIGDRENTSSSLFSSEFQGNSEVSFWDFFSFSEFNIRVIKSPNTVFEVDFSVFGVVFPSYGSEDNFFPEFWHVWF